MKFIYFFKIVLHKVMLIASLQHNSTLKIIKVINLFIRKKNCSLSYIKRWHFRHRTNKFVFLFQFLAILINTSLFRFVLLLLHQKVSHPGEQDVHVPSVELQGSSSSQFPLQLYWQFNPNVPFIHARNRISFMLTSF